MLSLTCSCDLIALAARDILRGSKAAQIVLAGPIGDETGEQAQALLAKGAWHAVERQCRPDERAECAPA